MLGWTALPRSFAQVLHAKSLAIDLALVLSIPVIGMLDGAAGSNVRLTSFFLIPIMLITWRAGTRTGYLATLAALAILLLLRVAEHAPGIDPAEFAIDVVGRFISFFIIVAILGRLHDVYSKQRILATRDALTSLHNRLGLLEILAVEVERSRRMPAPFTVVFLDCDNFKAVNDRWGHQTGDRLLQTVAHLLHKSVRKSDVACRLGGDEFVVFFSQTGENEAQGLIAKTKDNLDRAMREHGWPVTFSIGAAVFYAIPDDAEQVIDVADKLMYDIKQQGKDAVRIACYGKPASPGTAPEPA